MSENAWVVLWAWLSVVGDVTPPPGWEASPGAAQALFAVGVAEELVNPLECGTFTVEELRGLRRQLADAPRIRVLDNYPSEQYLDEQYAFSGKHIEWLKGQQSVAPWSLVESWQDWIDEANELRGVYRNLSYARFYLRTGHTMREVRELLRDTRDAIGAADLEKGILPPVVPLWRFRRAP